MKWSVVLRQHRLQRGGTRRCATICHEAVMNTRRCLSPFDCQVESASSYRSRCCSRRRWQTVFAMRSPRTVLVRLIGTDSSAALGVWSRNELVRVDLED